jgi:hypothetical protein
MKKSILTTLLIAGLAMTATFAADSSALTAYINATMDEVAYSFEINYDSSNFGNDATAAGQSLSSGLESTSGAFTVRTAENGNLEISTPFTVTITPDQFVPATTNTNGSDTGVYPIVVDDKTALTAAETAAGFTYTTANAGTAGTSGATWSYTKTIPFGEQSANIEMAKFKFQWTGNTSITAGDYESTIAIAIAAN